MAASRWLTYHELLDVVGQRTGEPTGAAEAMVLALITSGEVRLASRHPSTEPRDVVDPVSGNVTGKRSDIVRVERADAVEVVAWVQDPAVRDWASPAMAGLLKRLVCTRRQVLLYDEADALAWLNKRRTEKSQPGPADRKQRGRERQEAVRRFLNTRFDHPTKVVPSVLYKVVRDEGPEDVRLASKSTILRAVGRKKK